jgi:hypothetical protein
VTIHSAVDVAWLAGLLEGEGHFGMSSGRPGQRYPRIALKMTDEDIISRVAELWGRSYYVAHDSSRPSTYKTQYRTEIKGNDARDIMRAVLPHLGKRRAERVAELLAL